MPVGCASARLVCARSLHTRLRRHPSHGSLPRVALSGPPAPVAMRARHNDAMTYRVMTVCTGNICRSPMAEVVLRERFETAGLGDLVVVDSSGVSDEEYGNPVDRRARAVLAAHGYPTGDGHRARQVTPADLASRDLVLAMTAQHARRLRALAPGRVEATGVGGGGASDPAAGRMTGTASGIRMYRSFDPSAPVVLPGGSEQVLDVEDPWYGGHDDFETCLAEVEAAADGVVAFVRAELARTGRDSRSAEEATA